MKIKYSVTRELQRHSLSIENVTDEVVIKVLHLMNGGDNPNKVIPSEPLVKPAPVKKRTADELMEAVKQKQVYPELMVEDSKDDVLHKEHSNGFSIADRLTPSKEDDDATDQMYHIPETSIRLVHRHDDEDLETYLTKIHCPTCGATHTRYNPVSNKFTKCFTCSEKLELERAMPGFLQPDENGYLFMANRRYFHR